MYKEDNTSEFTRDKRKKSKRSITIAIVWNLRTTAQPRREKGLHLPQKNENPGKAGPGIPGQELYARQGTAHHNPRLWGRSPYGKLTSKPRDRKSDITQTTEKMDPENRRTHDTSFTESRCNQVSEIPTSHAFN